MNSSRILVLIGAIATTACTGDTAGGAPSDGQEAGNDADATGVVDAEAGVPDATGAPQDSTISIDTAPDRPSDAPSDARANSPSDVADAGSPAEDALDAGSDECGALSHGAAITTVLRSIFDAGGVQAPSVDGGTIATGTYYLTGRLVLANPNYAPAYTCDGNTTFETRDTYRFTATSTTTGSFDQDTELDMSDGGISRQVASGTYVLNPDPTLEMITFTDSCPTSPATRVAQYTAGPTQIAIIDYAYPSFTGQPVPPICSIYSTYTKQ